MDKLIVLGHGPESGLYKIENGKPVLKSFRHELIPELTHTRYEVIGLLSGREKETAEVAKAWLEGSFQNSPLPGSPLVSNLYIKDSLTGDYLRALDTARTIHALEGGGVDVFMPPLSQNPVCLKLMIWLFRNIGMAPTQEKLDEDYRDTLVDFLRRRIGREFVTEIQDYIKDGHLVLSSDDMRDLSFATVHSTLVDMRDSFSVQSGWDPEKDSSSAVSRFFM